MRIALFHNRYRHHGGEDTVVDLQEQSLRQAGHEVSALILRNDELRGLGAARAALEVAWSQSGYQQALEHLLRTRAEVGHVHNWFPRFSPSIYAAHRDAGVPVVQTLHNYRLGCAAGTYLREGQACFDCRGGERRAALRRGCYRGSRLGSAAWLHTVGRGWREGTFAQVDAYVAPSETVKREHVQLGLPAEKIHVIPHACRDPSPQGLSEARPEQGAVFLGRLSPEKGADVLIDAWRGLEAPGPLHLLGEGPERARLEERARGAAGVRFLGQRPPLAAQAAIAQAGVVVLPHRWLEPFGMVVIEAFAAGRPVIATRRGGPAELIRDGVDGLLVPEDDPAALRDALRSLLSSPRRLAAMGRAARARYEAQHQPERHERRLRQLYRSLTRLPVAAA